MHTEAFITREMLSWARQRAALSVGDAAQRVNVKPDKFEGWENGEGRPTLRQAQTIAEKLHIPFGYLYLAEPPTDELRLPDLRTVSDESLAKPSIALMDVVDDATRKQTWYREYLLEGDASPLPFVGEASADDSAETIAASLRETLGINERLRDEASSWEDFLRLLIGNVEESGILVLRSGVVGNNPHRPLDVTEFRGFAIVDELAPLIFINSRDAKVAQAFTLAHELAHVWIGVSGVSNPDYRQRASEQGGATERLCNLVAADVLVPGHDLRERWDERLATDENVRALAPRYRVSQLVVLRQAYDLELITSTDYWERYDDLIEQQAVRRSQESSGGNFYNTLFARSSLTFTTALLSAVMERRVQRTDAARLLNVKVSTLRGVEERIFGSTGGD